MTFSIVAKCVDTGQFGLAISSSSPAAAARCAFAKAGVGAVATQNVTNPALGPRADAARACVQAWVDSGSPVGGNGNEWWGQGFFNAPVPTDNSSISFFPSSTIRSRWIILASRARRSSSMRINLARSGAPMSSRS